MKLAIFDFDGTLFTKDTLPFLGQEWLRQGRSRLRYLLTYVAVMPVVILYKLGVVSRARMKYQAMTKFQRIFAGLSQAQIEDFFQQTSPYLSSYYNPQVLAEIKQAQAQGYHLVLLSGAYSLLLEQVAQDLQIDTVIGAQLYFKDGTIDYGRGISFVDGVNKLNLLKEAFAGQEVDWSRSRSYGDSFDDLLALEIAGDRVAVNPESRLLDYALENNWRVLA
jgi:HAD superfamily hydrolase (TIGR01490 family)